MGQPLEPRGNGLGQRRKWGLAMAAGVEARSKLMGDWKKTRRASELPFFLEFGVPLKGPGKGSLSGEAVNPMAWIEMAQERVGRGQKWYVSCVSIDKAT